jgi:hypothetical protein
MVISGVPNTEFLYAIQDANGKYGVVDSVGAIAWMGRFTPLKQHPMGWREFLVALTTNLKYWSLNRNVTIPLKFVGDGAKILRSKYYKGRGFDDEVYVQILKRNPEDGVYYEEYKGRLDFAKGVKDLPNMGFEVSANEGGILSFITANENVTYEIPCYGTYADGKALFDGVYLKDKYNYQFLPGSFPAEGDLMFAPAIYLNHEGDSIGIIHGNSEFGDTGTGAGSVGEQLAFNPNYILEATQDINVRLSGKLIVTGTEPTSFISASAQPGADISGGEIAPNTVIGTSTQTFNFDTTFALPANTKLFLIADFGSDIIIEEDSKFSLEFLTINEDSTAEFLRPLTLAKGIVSKMTDSKYTVESNYFTTNNKIVATCGPALRQLQNVNYVIKTSLADFFQAYDPDCNLGMKVVDSVLWIEPKDQLYNDSAEIWDLGEVADLEITTATDYLYNSVKSGCQSQSYSERNGRYEFNCTAERKAPVTQVLRELNLVSKYREDCFGIEFIRGKLNNKETTDDKSDNEVFKVVISDDTDIDGNYLLSRPAYSVMTGFFTGMPITGKGAPFNTELSPTRKVLANANRLAPTFFQQPVSSKLQFITCDKNKDFSTTLSGVTIAESADIKKSQLGTPLALPLMLKFKPLAPINYSQVVKNIGAGNIKLRYKGYDLYVLPIGEVAVKIATNEAEEWKLLASPLNNLETLFKLSLNTIFSSDYNDNMLAISELSPIHFVKYNNSPGAKYHHVEMFDDWVQNRNARFREQPYYFQKWQKTDPIRLQCVTAELGTLRLYVYDRDANEYEDMDFTVASSPAVTAPYTLQEVSVDLSDYDPGKYLFVIKSAGVPIAISEWQDIAVDHENTYAFEYYHTTDRLDTFFSSGYRPMFRAEALFLRWKPAMIASDYADESDNHESLASTPTKTRKIVLGCGTGVPEWVALKQNAILGLNRVTIEGEDYSRASADTQFEEIELVTGYPFAYYTVELKKRLNSNGLTINDSAITEPQFISSYTIDGKAVGQASGVITITTTNE